MRSRRETGYYKGVKVECGIQNLYNSKLLYSFKGVIKSNFGFQKFIPEGRRENGKYVHHHRNSDSGFNSAGSNEEEKKTIQ